MARELGLDRRTVRKYARARTWQEAMRRPPRKPSTLDPYLDYLRQRWDEGQHSAKALPRPDQTGPLALRLRAVLAQADTGRDVTRRWAAEKIALGIWGSPYRGFRFRVSASCGGYRQTKRSLIDRKGVC